MERFVFRVDASGMLPERAKEYLRRVKAAFRKKRPTDPRAGKLDATYHPLASDDCVCGPFPPTPDTPER